MPRISRRIESGQILGCHCRGRTMGSSSELVGENLSPRSNGKSVRDSSKISTRSRDALTTLLGGILRPGQQSPTLWAFRRILKTSTQTYLIVITPTSTYCSPISSLESSLNEEPTLLHCG